MNSAGTFATTNLIEDITDTARRLIRAEPDKTKRTPAFIAEQVRKSTATHAGDSASSVDQDQIIALLIQRNSRQIGKPTILEEKDPEHIDWLTASRKRDRPYWRRYRNYLESELPDSVVESLDEVTDEILRRLEDPNREGSWDRRGLVVGHVQSGKTSNYSGLICKAADAGYKIIIVLAGLHNNLRAQTQIRLEESFLGYKTTAGGEPGPAIGVAAFDDSLITNSATNRAENGDFSVAAARRFQSISPGEKHPWLFVVKKQKTVLTALLKWIQKRVADSSDGIDGRALVTKLPLLIIDDEADNASVDTGEQLFNDDGTPDEEHQPKTINSLIRQILHAFSRKNYVGYTATPFANIFIHQKAATTKEGADLFPRSFIVNLAAPDNYIGPVQIFGGVIENDRAESFPLTREINDHYDPNSNSGWMPPKHNRVHVPSYEGEEKIPTSLDEAICVFVLACAVRKLRNQGHKDSSMLIHVTRLVDVQNRVREQVKRCVNQMKQRLIYGVAAEELLEKLSQLWQRDFIPTHNEVSRLLTELERPPALPAWLDILSILPEVLQEIDVRSVNGTAKEAKESNNDDVAQPGKKLISVGGDKLSRGLTLEGLCVSYFVRTTKMYDTLMQMGRWFGYRPGYLDLCRLYTSSDLISWFAHIAGASEQLREEFDYMATADLTPEQYGLRVMSHEALTVTSPLKMRNSQKLSLTYSGSRPQTILFHRNAKIQEENLAAVDALVASLGSVWKEPKYERNGEKHQWKNTRLWTSVEVEKVQEFLSAYSTHPHASSAKAPIISEFISKMVEIGQLTMWSVALLGGGKGEGDEHSFPRGSASKDYFIRKTEDPSNLEMRDPKTFAIGVLTDPKDEGIDLSDEIWREALKKTKDAGRGQNNEPTGKALREIRAELGGEVDRGLLMLYPLSPYAYRDGKRDALIVPEWSKPIMGFAIAFPASKRTIKVEYDVNLLYWKQEYGPSE